MPALHTGGRVFHDPTAGRRRNALYRRPENRYRVRFRREGFRCGGSRRAERPVRTAQQPVVQSLSADAASHRPVGIQLPLYRQTARIATLALRKARQGPCPGVGRPARPPGQVRGRQAGRLRLLRFALRLRTDPEEKSEKSQNPLPCPHGETLVLRRDRLSARRRSAGRIDRQSFAKLVAQTGRPI